MEETEPRKDVNLQDVATELEQSISAIESCLFPQLPEWEEKDGVEKNTLEFLISRLSRVSARMILVRKELNKL